MTPAWPEPNERAEERSSSSFKGPRDSSAGPSLPSVARGPSSRMPVTETAAHASHRKHLLPIPRDGSKKEERCWQSGCSRRPSERAQPYKLPSHRRLAARQDRGQKYESRKPAATKEEEKKNGGERICAANVSRRGESKKLTASDLSACPSELGRSRAGLDLLPVGVEELGSPVLGAHGPGSALQGGPGPWTKR